MGEATANFQFWMNWWVQVAVSLFAFVAVLVALFGQNLFVRWWPPLLRLSIPSPEGQATPVSLSWTDVVPQQRIEAGRYYHLLVSNDRRWSHASQVQVCLVKIEEQTDIFEASWTGDIPLTWENQSAYPVLRSIGPSARIDLCSVVKGKGLYLHPLISALNLRAHWERAR